MPTLSARASLLRAIVAACIVLGAAVGICPADIILDQITGASPTTSPVSAPLSQLRAGSTVGMVDDFEVEGLEGTIPAPFLAEQVDALVYTTDLSAIPALRVSIFSDSPSQPAAFTASGDHQSVDFYGPFSPATGVTQLAAPAGFPGAILLRFDLTLGNNTGGLRIQNAGRFFVSVAAVGGTTDLRIATGSVAGPSSTASAFQANVTPSRNPDELCLNAAYRVSGRFLALPTPSATCDAVKDLIIDFARTPQLVAEVADYIPRGGGFGPRLIGGCTNSASPPIAAGTWRTYRIRLLNLPTLVSSSLRLVLGQTGPTSAYGPPLQLVVTDLPCVSSGGTLSVPIVSCRGVLPIPTSEPPAGLSYRSLSVTLPSGIPGPREFLVMVASPGFPVEQSFTLTAVVNLGNCPGGSTLVTQPGSQTVGSGNKVTLTANALPSFPIVGPSPPPLPPLPVTWSRNGNPVVNAPPRIIILYDTLIGNTLTIDPVLPTDAGQYTAQVSGASGAGCSPVLSNPGTLTVIACSSITVQPPPSVALVTGQALSLAIQIPPVSGLTRSIRWFKNGLPLIDDGRITGAAAATLSINPAVPGDSGTYLAQVGDFPAGGCSATCSTISTGSVVTVTNCPADFNADGLVNPDDLSDYINCYFTVPPCPTGDFNGDTFVNPDDLSDYINAYFTPCP